MITELVVNHTSDQHAWFQAARRAPPGSSKHDYYVWSDDPKRYAGTRIIFTDTESSNWTWDEVAKRYYWHRFFSHQPDLNFDNPQVLKAVVRAMRFWLDMGVDGFRLDAIPYLCERDGTSNENLPETHAVIKQIRASLDAHYGNRLLLAEANQWPEDVSRVLRRRGRVPHGLPLPAHAADVHGHRPGGPVPGDGDHGSRRPKSRRAASGRSSCAITTS